jgi:hypothetical protein
MYVSVRDSVLPQVDFLLSEVLTIRKVYFGVNDERVGIAPGCLHW